ncbi:hypothetical protein DWY99_00430 [[Clostridium] leptum]|uniref:Uncharacterized protein n=1 Tax=[Clostridium] leptum TaxID=1535 RepID=A0A412B1B2_9FIRM|nr:hypothetical protein DWY99_00430 [[Clostridium] leptum]
MLFFTVSRGGGQGNARQLKTNSHGERRMAAFMIFRRFLKEDPSEIRKAYCLFYPPGRLRCFQKMISGFE